MSGAGASVAPLRSDKGEMHRVRGARRDEKSEEGGRKGGNGERSPPPRISSFSSRAWRSIRMAFGQEEPVHRRSGRVGAAAREDLESIRSGAFSAGLVRYEQHGAGERTSRVQQCAAGLPWWMVWLGVHELAGAEVWRAGLGEFVGSFGYTLLQPGLGTEGIREWGGVGFGVLTGLIVAVLIVSLGPVSGGHFNCMISVSAASVGRMRVARTIVYVIAQCLGSLVAAWALLVSLGEESEASARGLCGLESGVEGRVLVRESALGFLLLFVIHATAMDPQQAAALGPVIPPFIIGLAVALLFAASFTIAPGTAFNASRCFGPAILQQQQNHYLHWVGNAIAVLLLRGYIALLSPEYLKKGDDDGLVGTEEVKEKGKGKLESVREGDEGGSGDP